MIYYELEFVFSLLINEGHQKTFARNFSQLILRTNYKKEFIVIVKNIGSVI
jgi:hypothetical protein